MADYVTHDAILDLGNDTPEDQSMNMLRFKPRGTTLVIVRSPVLPGQSLQDAVRDQMELLRRKTHSLNISGLQATRFGPDQQMEGWEMALDFTVGKQPNVQLQAACLIPGQQRMLVLNYSKHGLMNNQDLQHWRALKRGLRLTDNGAV
ncbi:DcrB-related protein [Pseudomonas sp. PSKL.D1]|uniref:DcrB-related protein n=1 Tax=Pseudomonas sp. PSKL.D1 TaxID=3029060 RepID=UPI002380DD23|nr:DcrB-related protein [Pseudomonas sp. PSKL.D1]WDY55986.1 DcrB-related protein [Pseudomonas sp. PSKL.D1]